MSILFILVLLCRSCIESTLVGTTGQDARRFPGFRRPSSRSKADLGELFLEVKRW
jgi:hypothetical protein